jgi:U3 small nucleolar RNA-associated protein 3
MDGDQLWRLHKQIALEENELLELLGDAGLDAGWSTSESSPAPISNFNGPPKKKRKTSASASTATSSEPTKEKVKFKLPTFDLVEPTFQPSKSKPKPKSTSHHARGAADVFGEPTVLEHADAADKAARKRTLRFHTAKIESSRMRRQGARESAAGGDDDLPYRERERERKKGKDAKRGMGGEDLNDVEPVMADHLMDGDGGEDGHEDEEGADGYYELVQRRSRENKEKKKADYEEAQAAARYGPYSLFNLPIIVPHALYLYSSVLDVDDVSTGPRSLTRAILANKGLTPRRAKSVRNPRVKKRERFEKAKRKVSSQKAIYKGGIGDVSKYAGEKSGISKVIKSVKLA